MERHQYLLMSDLSILMRKMSWLEFRHHPKSDWMEGEFAKNVRQSIGMLVTSFVSIVKRV